MADRDERGRFIKGNKVGKKGWQAMVSKHRSKLSEWGKQGYAATVERHFGGDRDAANDWLAKKGQAASDQLNGYQGFFYVFEDPGMHPAHAKQNGRA